MLLPVRFFSIYKAADLGCLHFFECFEKKRVTPLPLFSLIRTYSNYFPCLGGFVSPGAGLAMFSRMEVSASMFFMR